MGDPRPTKTQTAARAVSDLAVSPGEPGAAAQWPVPLVRIRALATTSHHPPLHGWVSRVSVGRRLLLVNAGRGPQGKIGDGGALDDAGLEHR